MADVKITAPLLPEILAPDVRLLEGTQAVDVQRLARLIGCNLLPLLQILAVRPCRLAVYGHHPAVLGAVVGNVSDLFSGSVQIITTLQFLGIIAPNSA